MYFSIAKPDIQKLLVKNSRTKLVVRGFARCTRIFALVWSLITLPIADQTTLFSERVLSLDIHSRIYAEQCSTKTPFASHWLRNRTPSTSTRSTSSTSKTAEVPQQSISA